MPALLSTLVKVEASLSSARYTVPCAKLPQEPNTNPEAPVSCIATCVHPFTAVPLTSCDHDAPPLIERKRPVRVAAQMRNGLRGLTTRLLT